MNNRTLIIIAYNIIMSLFVIAVCGQEPTPDTDDGHPPFTPGVRIEGTVGFGGLPPSYLCMLKAERRHSQDVFLSTGSWVTDRLILTCEHNVKGVPRSENLKVHCMDGTEYTDCKVVQRSKTFDLALIYVGDESVAYHSTLSIQNDAYPLGILATMGWNPTEWSMCLYQGRANGRKFGSRGYRRVFFGHSATTVQGMSGGPVIDESMSLVGVIVSGGSNAGSLAVELSRVQAFLTSYKGKTGRLQLNR